MTHVLIVGMTESGKTTLAVQLAKSARDQGIPVVVLDPLADPRWQADHIGSDPVAFLDIAQRSRSCALFIDESAEVIGRYNDAMFWLATRARHYGHKSYFITQRTAQLAKTIRDQCRHLFMFCVSMNDAKIMADEFNREELRKANELAQFEYFYISRFGTVEKRRVSVDFT